MALISQRQRFHPCYPLLFTSTSLSLTLSLSGWQCFFKVKFLLTYILIVIAVVRNLSLSRSSCLSVSHFLWSWVTLKVSLALSDQSLCWRVLAHLSAGDAVWEKEREANWHKMPQFPESWRVSGAPRLRRRFRPNWPHMPSHTQWTDYEMKGPGGQDTPSMAPSSLRSVLKVYKPRLHRVHFKVSRSFSCCSSFKVKVKTIQTFGCVFSLSNKKSIHSCICFTHVSWAAWQRWRQTEAFK